MATNGDVITKVPLREVVEHHRLRGYLAALVLSPFISPYGVVDVDDEDRITRLHEKPALPYCINAGVYGMDRAVRDPWPDQGDHDPTTFPELAQRGRL